MTSDYVAALKHHGTNKSSGTHQDSVLGDLGDTARADGRRLGLGSGSGATAVAGSGGGSGSGEGGASGTRSSGARGGRPGSGGLGTSGSGKLFGAGGDGQGDITARKIAGRQGLDLGHGPIFLRVGHHDCAHGRLLVQLASDVLRAVYCSCVSGNFSFWGKINKYINLHLVHFQIHRKRLGTADKREAGAETAFVTVRARRAADGESRRGGAGTDHRGVDGLIITPKRQHDGDDGGLLSAGGGGGGHGSQAGRDEQGRSSDHCEMLF